MVAIVCIVNLCRIPGLCPEDGGKVSLAPKPHCTAQHLASQPQDTHKCFWTLPNMYWGKIAPVENFCSTWKVLSSLEHSLARSWVCLQGCRLSLDTHCWRWSSQWGSAHGIPAHPSLLYKNQLLKPEAALRVDFRAVAELIPSPITLPAAQGF